MMNESNIPKFCKDCVHCKPYCYFGIKWLASYDDVCCDGPRCTRRPKLVSYNVVTGTKYIYDYIRCNHARMGHSFEENCGVDAKFFKNK